MKGNFPILWGIGKEAITINTMKKNYHRTSRVEYHRELLLLLSRTTVRMWGPCPRQGNAASPHACLGAVGVRRPRGAMSVWQGASTR